MWLQGLSCDTLTHENIQMLLSKLEALVEYVAREDVFDDLTSPEHAQTLLQVVNSALPSVVAQVSSYHTAILDEANLYV